MTRPRTKNHDLRRFPIADHPLSDIEALNQYGDTIRDLLDDLQNPGMALLRRLATGGHRIAEKLIVQQHERRS